MDRKRRISRVDVQVSIVTAVLVTTALICVYFFNYFITHEDMINSLKERSHSIYQYVDDYVDKTTFQNTEALTRDNPAYIRMYIWWMVCRMTALIFVIPEIKSKRKSYRS